MNEQDLSLRIENRIEQLKEKIEILINERESLSKRIEDVNTELTHLVGGIRELDSLLKDQAP